MKENRPVFQKAITSGERDACAKLLASSEPWLTLGIREEALRKTLQDPIHEVFVVRLDGPIAGTMVIQPRGAFSVYLKSIAVHPSLRGKGLGNLMMDFLEELVFSTAPNLFLCVSSFNEPAQKFYRKRGFQTVGELKDYLVTGHNEILMRKTRGPLLPGGFTESMS